MLLKALFLLRDNNNLEFVQALDGRQESTQDRFPELTETDKA